MKFKTKPVIKEAIQFTGQNVQECMDFGGENSPIAWDCKIINGKSPNIIGGDLVIETLEGDMIVSPNDWIIKGLNGEFYPCKPDIFEKTYEPVV